jgi:protein-disulfide isomerase
MQNNNEPRRIRGTFTYVFFAFSFGLLISALVMKHTSTAKADSSQALITYKGVDKTLKDLPLTIAMPLFQLEKSVYDEKSRLLEEAAIQMYIGELAKKNKQTEDQVRADLFKVDKVSDDEVNAFYKANQAHIKQPFFEIKDRIAAYLKAQEVQKKRIALLDKMKKDGDLAILIKPPVSPVVTVNTKGYPSIGNPKSGVKVVEFADYQCPHCRHANETFHKLLKTDSDKFQLVYMDFPINRSGISRIVAEGAVCADQQGKFWEYHDAAFAHQEDLTKDWPGIIAKKLKLDDAKFQSCMKDPKTPEKVRTAEKEAIHLGATGTPTIFINGQLYQGHNNDTDLVKAILSAKPLKQQ